MAANDITISVASASQSIQVHAVTTPTKNQIAKSLGDPITVVAGGSTVIALGMNDVLMIERVDATANAIGQMPLQTRKSHRGQN